MRYLSVCSGIEAATVAWHPLGWEPFAFAEIEKFPSAVLAHHYPSVPNLGDMTKFKDWPDADINVLVGGTPCQSFSVAGLRKGMADPRGNLALTYLAIADRYRPEWLLWENVPGVLSSSGGRDFGAFIGGLAELGYHASWRVLDAQYVRVDGFARAVPQRRRRVFVVGHLGDWRRSAAVLFERESLLWNSAPRRQAGQSVAPTISSRPTGGGGLGTDFDCDGGLIASTGDVAHCLNAGGMGRQDYETETMVIAPPAAATLTRGAESAGKGGYAGRRREDDHNLVAFDTTQITSKANRSSPQPGDPCHPLAAGAHAPAIAFDARQSDVIQYGEKTGPLDTDGHTMAVAYGIRNDASRSGEAKTPSLDANGVARLRNAGLNIYEGLAPTLDTGAAHSVATAWAVRRLTPRECERLQGFPDGYTAIPKAADGPRYKSLGNSMAVNAMRWLGRRIELTTQLSSDQRGSE